MIKIADKNNKISLEELREMAANTFGNLVKAAVDINLEIMAAGGDLHADEESALLEKGSRQEDVWGINIYPDKDKEDD